MNRISVVALLVVGTLPFTVGCASKKYVRNQTQPVVNKVNELDDLTAKTSTEIRDTDSRAQRGIQSVQAKAGEADQKAVAAGQSANQAQQFATQVSGRADQLTNTVINLDNYKPVSESSVHFAFDRYSLSKQAKEALDQLAEQLPNAKHFIVVVDGSTDSVGGSDYNYTLSKRRADAVISYLETKESIPAYRIYVIGLGKDKPVESNKTAKGRAENRRVNVRLMTNIADENAQTAASAPSGQALQQ
jgi:outer membrane protein OmpA-like peptidoglycan-associated protein